ncbi:hypothetical protein QQZ08_000381 [Neonectria magnoliae]|uniref:Uncharacterized protein n=1 Tax=Neonectria magnoliae TaxID=2732573 RepID=A0ABR1II93_9HYPO
MDTRSQSSWRSLFTFFSISVVSLVLIFYAAPSPPGLNPHVSITERGFPDNVIANFTKRQNNAYEKAREKGAKLHCLMAMSIEEARLANKGVSLESPEYLQKYGTEENEGWDTTSTDDDAPYFRNYLDTAFSALGITKKTVDMHWANVGSGEIYDNPDDPDFDQLKQGVPTGAFFTTSFILDPGVIIADSSRSVKAAIDQNNNWLPGSPVTHLRQWSDAAWTQWTRACAFANPQVKDVDRVKYIIRSRVINESTLSVLFQALINKYGGTPTIGKWDNRLTLDVEKNPKEFHAVLGTPNGAASAYFLLNHKEKLKIKTLDKVDIFIPNIPYTIFGAGVDDTAKSAKVMLLFTVTTP